ncbi:MAG: 5-formyltetrahydrofolate cyclo-ligase [Novosphingobium sp.]
MNKPTEKQLLRQTLRKQRRDYVAALPEGTRALLFLRPPAPLAALAPEGSVIGLYHAMGSEAPTRAWANWFRENGRTIALPWFAGRGNAMRFREWRDPLDDSSLTAGPFRIAQPGDDAPELTPGLVVVPLTGFTAHCDRIGQGAGHYDAWLAAHPGAKAIGLAWDCQLVESLPLEPHDRRLDAVVTPSRFYEAQD